MKSRWAKQLAGGLKLALLQTKRRGLNEDPGCCREQSCKEESNDHFVDFVGGGQMSVDKFKNWIVPKVDPI